jgi:ATP-dependent protease ClpP protease subunit
VAALYGPGRSHARGLIRAGKVNEDSSWSFSAEDGNAILGDPPDWTRYASWHLGYDADADRDTKAAWKYPFGKGGSVYRSGLRAIASRASQQGDTEIANAASAMIRSLDDGDDGASDTARAWYRFEPFAKTDPAEADLYIYDVIGDWGNEGGVSARQFVRDLHALPKSVSTIRLHLNSPGGSVFDAIAIANALQGHAAAVEVRIGALVASAATIVMMGGDRIVMPRNALAMIHDPWAFAFGAYNSEALRDLAEQLDAIRDPIIATYGWHSTLPASELAAMMSATTWMDADEALAHGFATEIAEPVKIAALFDPAVVARLAPIPSHLQARVDALTAKPEPPTPPSPPSHAEAAEVLSACKGAGVLELAEELVTAKATAGEVSARIAHAREINALCATAKLPSLASGYIRARTPVAIVREHLTTMTAALDRLEVDGALHPDAGSKSAPVSINPRDVYARRNAPLALKGA